MVSYNPNVNKKSLGTIIIITIFAIIGAVCIIIGYKNEFLSWLMTFGVVICVLMFPILIFLLYQLIKKKIKDM